MTTRIKGKLAERAKETGVVVPIVTDYLRNREPGFRRQDIIHPSEMAKADWCVVDTYNHIMHAGRSREELKFSQENIFAEGNAIHTKWQTWLQESGELWGNWKCQACAYTFDNSLSPQYPCPQDHFLWEYTEIPLSSESHMIAGHADGAVRDCLIELKSVGLGTIRIDDPRLLNKYHVESSSGKKVYDLDGLWNNIHRPVPSHMRQGQIYLWLAREMGLPFTKIQFVYEFKPNQQVKEFSVSLSEEIVNPLLEKALRIKDAVLSGTPPVCDLEGCKSCLARAESHRKIVRATASTSLSARRNRS
jgi:hypothetical protein